MHLLFYFLIALSAFLVDAIMQLFIYFSVTPYGNIYMSSPLTHYIHGIFYSGIVITVMTWPFLLSTLFKKLKPIRIALFEVLFFFCYIVLNHADHEVIRFIGNHYSIQMMTTYNVFNGNQGAFVFDTLREDQRGSYSAFTLVIIPFVWSLLVLILRKKLLAFCEGLQTRLSSSKQRILSFAIIGAVILFPAISFSVFVKTDRTYGTHYISMSRPQIKVAPFPMILIHDLRIYSKQGVNDYSQIDQQIDHVQNMWLQSSSDPHWKFISHDRPLRKTYTGECVKREKQPNIVLLMVESLHSTMLQDFNPKAERQIMPFIHEVITGESSFLKENGLHSAYYTHYFTNGEPTLDALLAIHTGLPPHSNLNVSSQFIQDQSLKSFSQYLSAHGYVTTYIDSICGGFDSKGTWMTRLYDRYQDLLTWDDSVTLNALYEAIQKNRQEGHPYEISTELASNHIPFNLPESEPALPDDMPLAERSSHVIQYDDQLIRSFFERLAQNDALSDTIFLITGDHGYDFGEYLNPNHVETGYNALRANITWLPLIVIAPYDYVPQGEQKMIASHADLAPTILEMAGICDDNGFAGHSLLSATQKTALNCRATNFSYINDHYTSIFIVDEAPQLYSFDDQIQAKDLHKDHPEQVEAMRKEALDWRNVLDYSYEGDRF